MKYSDGTVTVSADPTVTGSGTAWTDYIEAGDLFMVLGDEAFYTVASVTDDTHLELTASYAGTPAAGQSYQITVDFTPNYNIPEIHGGERDWSVILTQALRMIDTELKSQSDRITALE
jgi:hypothetical protein